jgi:hypothetical protein
METDMIPNPMPSRQVEEIQAERRYQSQTEGAVRLTTDQVKKLPLTISLEEKIKLENAAKGGSSWLIWVGVLSIVNTILSLTKGGLTFFIGLGATQIVDALPAILAKRGGADIATLQTVAVLFNFSLASVFIIFGLLAKRKQLKWALVVGMVLYALDGLIFIWAKDWFGLAFHAFALFMMYGSLQANRKLKEAQTPASAEFNLSKM